MKKILIRRWHLFAFIFIFILAIVLRFYNFPFRYSLGEETVRDAVIGIEGARQIQFPLTGAFSSLGPFTFGPWYAYQLILFSMIVPHLYAPWIYLSLASLLYIFVIYRIGILIAGGGFGLILALIAAIAPPQIISATHLTSHNMTNLYAVLCIWIFLKLVKNKLSYWWNFALGFCLGIGINLHFQMTGLLILPVILFFLKSKRYVAFLCSVAGLFVSFVPLFVFELNNHWFTSRNLIYYFFHGKEAIYVPNRWLFYVRDFWPSFWADALGVPVWLAVLVIIIFSIASVFAYRKKKLPLTVILLLIAFLVNFVLLRYYWGPRFFGYLNFLRPFVFIFTGFVFLLLSRTTVGRFTGIALAVILLTFVVPRSLAQLVKDPFTMGIYQAVNTVTNTLPNEKFALYSCASSYTSQYNATVFSTLFLLNLTNSFDGFSEKKLAIYRDCDLPKDSISKATHVSENTIGLIDISYASPSALVRAGYSPESFTKMYDAYARWWFKEQP